MFNKTIGSVFSLMEILTGICGDLTPDQILYWSRNKEELEKILKKKGFQFLIENRKKIIIPKLPGSHRKIITTRRPPFKGFLYEEDRAKLLLNYSATQQVESFFL